MFRTSVHGFFPDLSRAYNMVRVIEGKIVQKLGVPSGKCQGEFVYLLWNVPIQIFAIYFFFIILEV